VQPTHQCASDHPILACNPDTLASDFERHGGFLGCDAPERIRGAYDYC
jgi:hypothetical protein